jgi:phosphatidate cytidylyltransferase
MGAYFVGVSLGKTKLCPEISPKKTVEGALGGIISSVIVSLVITLCFSKFDKILPVMLLTIPLCVVGIAGDLFASIIKRKVGIKDYGNLIPGHGGILDRVDSVLFISPLVYCLMLIGVI